MKYANYLSLITLLIFVCSCQSNQSEQVQTIEKIPIKVVVVSMFEMGEDEGDRPGEFQLWVERFPLDSVIAFPQGYRKLRYNKQGVLGMVTGIGTAKSAASIMALGMDPRFNLSNAYWLIVGISGVDPADASVGSAAWAEWVVDGDLSHQIDAREIPEDWATGYIPLRLSKPYEMPMPQNNEGVVYQLNTELVDWAYNLTKDIQLPDNESIAGFRALYKGFPNAQKPPFVLKGDQLAAMTYWHGEKMNQWANDWVNYWTKGSGNFVTSAMEDTGSLQALTFLAKTNKVNLDQVLVLRSASNYTMQYEGITAVESLAGEKLRDKGYTAYIPALESAYIVGSEVVKALLEF